MARIAGVDLPRDQAGRDRADLHLRHRAAPRRTSILTAAGVSGDVRVKDLSEDDVRKISRVIEEQGGVEGDLRKEISMNIKRLIEIGSYRGLRHRREPAGARTAHAHQRPHPQGPAQGRGRQEEDRR